jgi:lipopolysaccharide heptosyltransferase II
MKIEKEEIKKILCIKPRGIGDIIHSTIVLENLHAFFPRSEIHYLTEEFAKRAVTNNPFVQKVLVFNRKDFVFKVVKKVRAEKYDLIFDFWSNPKTAQITFLSGVKYRVGFDYRGRRYAYNFKSKTDNPNLHAAENHLILLEHVGIPIISKKTIFHLSEEEKKYAKDFAEKHLKNIPVIGILPSGGWQSKRCEIDKWLEICNAIQKKYYVQFFILWGPGDENDAEEIKKVLGEEALLAPKTSLGELSGLLGLCNLIIANDSGPMHIAAAMEIPIIGLFGPTNPNGHRPYSSNSDYVIKSDLHCIICNKLICPYDHECMKQLSVNDILEKAEILGSDFLVKS